MTSHPITYIAVRVLAAVAVMLALKFVPVVIGHFKRHND